jgi:hypothetical protein
VAVEVKPSFEAKKKDGAVMLVERGVMKARPQRTR